MGGYFTSISRVFQILANRPSEILVKYFHASDHSHGGMEVFHEYFARTVRGDNLRGRITSLLLYILVPVPVKYPPMELRELHTRVFHEYFAGTVREYLKYS